MNTTVDMYFTLFPCVMVAACAPILSEGILQIDVIVNGHLSLSKFNTYRHTAHRYVLLDDKLLRVL